VRYIIVVEAPDEPVSFEGIFARSVERKTLAQCVIVRVERVYDDFMERRLPPASGGNGHP
jgi:hypothetical protein